MKTVFCDIDGTIVFHYGLGLSGQLLNDAVALPAVIERMNEWQAKGYNIVLTTYQFGDILGSSHYGIT